MKIRGVMSEAEGRMIVYARSQGRCECCTRPASEWHHRANRSQGGGWTPANGLHVCSWCHRWITEHPSHAVMLGVGSLPASCDPATVPAYIHPTSWWRGWWLPDDDGCWTYADNPPDGHESAGGRSGAVAAFAQARLSEE